MKILALTSMIKNEASKTPKLSKRASYSRKKKLWIPEGLIKKLSVKEAHSGCLASHFGTNKTIDMMKEDFYLLKMGG